MLFTSPLFLFCFLPLVLFAVRCAAVTGPQAQALVLLAFSLLFAASWDMGSLCLFGATIVLNYCFAQQLCARPRKVLLALAVVINCLPLFWYKYANFLLANIGYLLSTEISLPVQAFPPGISFTTFIQIAWLVSVYRGSVRPEGLARHALFSSFFPYLLSGPLVRYEQMGPQFDRAKGPCAESLALGASLFCVGLAKKLLLADALAPLANTIFTAAAKGWPLSSAEAWLGSLSYSFQLYFDFSGYTDMAIGIGLMLGLQLPENFFSPYKATGIVDFWRRWHITLGLWLRDFLYIPMGGNRVGKIRQYRNLFLTMLIGGLWHGAGWTFVLWGALHGFMLCINHAFRSVVRETAAERVLNLLPIRLCSIALTFCCINACWVFFRAESVPTALHLLGLMVSPDLTSSLDALCPNNYIQSWIPCAVLGLSCVLIWAFPCSHEIFMRTSATEQSWLRFRFSKGWALLLSCLALLSLLLSPESQSFLYFQF